MKKSVFSVVAGMVLMVAGCATKPGYVGQWKSINLPQDVKHDGVECFSMSILEQGGLSILAEAADGTINQGANGSWTTNAVGGIDIVVDKNEQAKGLLLDDNTLVITADDEAIKFARQK